MIAKVILIKYIFISIKAFGINYFFCNPNVLNEKSLCIPYSNDSFLIIGGNLLVFYNFFLNSRNLLTYSKMNKELYFSSILEKDLFKNTNLLLEMQR